MTCGRKARHGLTLVEVLASLALTGMATTTTLALLSSMTALHSAVLRTAGEARRMEALGAEWARALENTLPPTAADTPVLLIQSGGSEAGASDRFLLLTAGPDGVPETRSFWVEEVEGRSLLWCEIRGPAGRGETRLRLEGVRRLRIRARGERGWSEGAWDSRAMEGLPELVELRWEGPLDGPDHSYVLRVRLPADRSTSAGRNE